MNKKNQEVADKVSTQFGESIIGTSEFRGDLTIDCKPEVLLDLLRFLRDSPELEYNFLANITAVDYLEYKGIERFAVVYNLLSFRYKHRITVKAWVPEDSPEIESATSLWSTADWQEREVWDLFGIRFRGHPNLVRIMNPDDFKYHPLRKDYPLHGKGERQNFRVVTREVGSKYKE